MLITRPRRAGAAQGARARPVTEAAAPRPTPCGCALSRLVARARTVAWTFACPRRTSPMSVLWSRSLAVCFSVLAARLCVPHTQSRTYVVGQNGLRLDAKDNCQLRTRRPLPLWLCAPPKLPAQRSHTRKLHRTHPGQTHRTHTVLGL